MVTEFEAQTLAIFLSDLAWALWVGFSELTILYVKRFKPFQRGFPLLIIIWFTSKRLTKMAFLSLHFTLSTVSPLLHMSEAIASGSIVMICWEFSAAHSEEIHVAVKGLKNKKKNFSKTYISIHITKTKTCH